MDENYPITYILHGKAKAHGLSDDVVIPDGPIEQRFAELKTCVRTRKKYESLRLR